MTLSHIPEDLDLTLHGSVNRKRKLPVVLATDGIRRLYFIFEERAQ
jgi:hypothetical protein